MTQTTPHDEEMRLVNTAKIKKALWIVREYIKDAVDSSDLGSYNNIDDCTTEIPVSDLRVIEEALDV